MPSPRRAFPYTDLEWAVLTELRKHIYQDHVRSTKPGDPGWHACTCGWEGYWSAWQPHVAKRLAQAFDA